MTTLTSKELDIKRGDTCPECGSTDTMHNSAREYRCRDCEHGWGYDGEWYGIGETLAAKIDRISAGM